MLGGTAAEAEDREAAQKLAHGTLSPTILEVKCPYSARDLCVLDTAATVKYFYTLKLLKVNHIKCRTIIYTYIRLL